MSAALASTATVASERLRDFLDTLFIAQNSWMLMPAAGFKEHADPLEDPSLPRFG
jgi:hypothetical protein